MTDDFTVDGEDEDEKVIDLAVLARAVAEKIEMFIMVDVFCSFPRPVVPDVSYNIHTGRTAHHRLDRLPALEPSQSPAQGHLPPSTQEGLADEWMAARPRS